jgi:hypothetical protein
MIASLSRSIAAGLSRLKIAVSLSCHQAMPWTVAQGDFMEIGGRRCHMSGQQGVRKVVNSRWLRAPATNDDLTSEQTKPVPEMARVFCVSPSDR